MLNVEITYDNGYKKYMPLNNTDIQINLNTQDVIRIRYKGEDIDNFTHVKSIRICD